MFVYILYQLYAKYLNEIKAAQKLVGMVKAATED